MKVKGQISEKQTSSSSDKLINFLLKNDLHKKDFAEMIGVTLSYVYSLIDKTIAFSTRTTTIERIATVMDLDPNEFPEYKISEEPKLIDEGVDFLKKQQKKMGMSNVALLKKFPRKKRVEIVDLWRGSSPLPLDWKELSAITDVLCVTHAEIYPYWQNRIKQYLTLGGMDLISNADLLNEMFKGAQKYLKI